MRRRPEGYHRTRRWQPSGRQRQVLDALVQGFTNSEIAGQLGISADGVKWHVGELLAETGREDRQALARWWQHERDRISNEERPATVLALAVLRRAWPAALLLGALAVVALIVTLRGGGDGRQPATLPQSMAVDEPPLTATAPPAATVLAAPDCDAALAAGFATVSAQDLRSQGLVEVGHVVEPQSCPLRVSNRADQAFFWMADGGTIEMESAGLHRVTAFRMYRGSNYPPSDLGFYYNGEQFKASMFGTYDGDQTSLYITNGVEPNGNIDLRPGSEQGIYVNVTLEGESSGAHKVAFDSDGDLFFDPGPLADNLAINWYTGEPIDVGGMRQIGTLTLHVLAGKTPTDQAARNSCNVMTAGVCSVALPALDSYLVQPLVPGQQPSFTGATLPAPISGRLSCVALDFNGSQLLSYELDAGSYRLHFQAYGGYGVPWNDGCAPKNVAAGDPLAVWVYTEIEAVTRDGSPISVVATRDGRLYVGDANLQLGCPCQAGD